MHDLYALDSVKVRNVKLERELSNQKSKLSETVTNVKDSCMHDIESVNNRTNKLIADIRSACVIKVSKKLENCSLATKTHLHGVAKQIGKFSNSLEKKNKIISNLRVKAESLKSDHEACVMNGEAKLAKVSHNFETRKIALQQDAQNLRKQLTESQRHNHAMARNISDTGEAHQALLLDHHIVTNDLIDCQTRYEVHSLASKKLNNSMEAYQRLVKVYEKKDQGCQTSLKICRTRAPVISKQVSHLLKLNEGQQKQHSDCLAAKTGLAANLTSCHSELVVAHERVHNATVNKNLLETHNRVGKIKTAACLNDKELLDRSYKLELEEKKILLESNKGLETEIGSLTVLLNSTKMDLENLTESFHALKQEFFAQQTTIETLLSQEKEKELVYLNKEKEYAETVLKHDHLKEKLIRFESRYWTTQTELTRCISSNPFYHGSKNGTVLAAGPNVGLNNTVASYWKEQIFKQSQLVTECMKRVSNSTKPTEYSLADLEKLVMTSKNYIPVPNEHLFTAKNSLKTCNKVYEKCRVDLNSCQVAYLKEVAGQGKHQLLPSLHSNDILDSRGKTTAKKKLVTHVSTVKPTVKPAPATLTTTSAMPAKPSKNPATTTTTTTILPVSAKAKIGAGTNTTPAPVESTTGAGSVDSTTGPAGKSTKYLSFMQA